MATIYMILLAFFAIGCAATPSEPRLAAPIETGAVEGPTPAAMATYGALTAVGVSSVAVGGYFIAEAERSPDRTGSRPEFWGGVQAVAGGAALAIPFGYLTTSSLLAHDDDRAGAERSAQRPSPSSAREAGVAVRPRIGPGSIHVSGEF